MHENRYNNILVFWNTLSHSSKEFLDTVLNEANNLPDDAVTLPQLPEISSSSNINEAPSNAGNIISQANTIEVRDDKINFSALVSSFATNSDELQVALLLQSLRFRLSRTPNGLYSFFYSIIIFSYCKKRGIKFVYKKRCIELFTHS